VVEGVKEVGVACAVVEVSQEVSRVIGVGVGCVAEEELVVEAAFGAHSPPTCEWNITSQLVSPYV
jgi:hypothetical protein